MIGIKLRQEIISARDEAELVRNINPVISWDDFTPPEGPDRPAKLVVLKVIQNGFLNTLTPRL